MFQLASFWGRNFWWLRSDLFVWLVEECSWQFIRNWHYFINGVSVLFSSFLTVTFIYICFHSFYTSLYFPPSIIYFLVTTLVCSFLFLQLSSSSFFHLFLPFLSSFVHFFLLLFLFFCLLLSKFSRYFLLLTLFFMFFLYKILLKYIYCTQT